MVYNNLINCNQHLPKKMDQEKKMKREIANSNERRRMQSINAGFNSLRTMLPLHDNEKLSKAAILQHTAEYIDQLEQDKTRYLHEVRAMEKLLNPDLLDLHQKNLQERESKLIDHQPNLKRIKLEVNNSLDLSNSESSDEGIQCNSSPKQENQQSLNLTQSNANKPVLLSTNDKVSLNIGNEHLSTTAQLINGNQILLTKSNNHANVPDDLEAIKADLLNTRQVLDKERKLRMKLEEQVRTLEAQLYPTRIKEIAQQVQLQFQAGTNSFPFSIQTKDLETDTVQSVVIEHMGQNVEDVVAETVEIETQDCAEFLVNSTNTINLIANNNHLLNQTNINSINNLNREPSVNKSSTIHLTLPSDLQSINNSMNNNLINATNQTKDKLIMEVVPNKILTSTAYVTTGYCTVQQNQFKPKNFSRTDKNVNKPKQINQIKNNSPLVSSNSSPNSAITTSTNKKTQAHTAITSNSSVTSSTSLKTINQNESTSKKDKQQQKKPKLSNTSVSSPASITVSYTNASAKEPVAYDGNVEMTTTNGKSIEQVSLVQTSSSETAAAVQMIDNCNQVTSTLDSSTINKTTSKSATSNNLDTIVEAIRHLEGDMFGDQNSGIVIESKKQLDKFKLCKDDKELVEELRSDKEAEERMSTDVSSIDQIEKDQLMKNDLSTSSASRVEGVVVSSS